jgi:glycerol-3-phosphate dehydrogenase
LDQGPGTGKRLQLTKGVHLVFPFDKFPIRQSVYFDVPDGRMIFGIPRGKVTYVGTTDTKYTGDPKEVKTSLTDALYLISAVNHMFPDIELELKDIQSSWAGLRPLIQEEGKTAGELSRKDEIFESATGLISIAGGKLTGYRKMAERTVDLIEKRISKDEKKSLRPIQTESISLTEEPFEDYKEVKKYIKTLLPRLNTFGFDKKDMTSLVQCYGKQTEIILDKFGDLKDKDPEIRLAKAELWFTLRYEMVAEPLDFFERRTGRLYFDALRMEKLIWPLLLEFAKVFNWDEDTLTKQRGILENALLEIRTFE